MTPTEFKGLRKQARDLHASQPATDKLKVSIDAIFIALAAEAAKNQRRAIRRVSEEAAPEWFNETLAKLKGTGEKVTVGRFLLLAGKFPAQRSDSLATSRWLREAGYTPKKIGGNLIFEL